MGAKLKWISALILLGVVLLFISKYFFDQYNQTIEVAQNLGTASSVFQDPFPDHQQRTQILTTSGTQIEVPVNIPVKAGDAIAIQIRRTGLVYLCVNSVCRTARVTKVESLGLLKSLSVNNPTRESSGNTLIGIGADGTPVVVFPVQTTPPAETHVKTRDRYILIRGQVIIDTQAQLILKSPLGRPARAAALCETVSLRCFEVIES